MNTTQTKRGQKRRMFELICAGAEEQNPELWNCSIDLSFSSKGSELDQYAALGYGKCSLYQVGDTAEQRTGRTLRIYEPFTYSTSIN